MIGKDFSRNERVAVRIHKALANLIQTELADPSLMWVTVQDVRLSRDLSNAVVSISVLGEDGAEVEVVKRLNRASGRLRSRLGRSLRLRGVPHLRFVYDEQSEKTRRLDQLLDNSKSNL